MGVMGDFAQSVTPQTVHSIVEKCAEVKKEKEMQLTVKTNAGRRSAGISYLSIKQVLCVKDDHTTSNMCLCCLEKMKANVTVCAM